MPNFIAKNIKNVAFPFAKNGVEFLWEVSSGDERLIFAKYIDTPLLLVVKKRKDDFVIKGDKITRPAIILALQNVLFCFMENFAQNTLNATIKADFDNDLAKNVNFDQIALIKSLNSTKFQQIFIEIGFGSGRHLLFQAQNNPDALIIGIEIYKPSIAQVSFHAKNFKNILLLNLDARLAISMIKSNLVDKIFLHFPVPWQKSEKRRVVSEIFAAECQRVLKVGGTFELRSDEADYINFSVAKFLTLNEAKIEIFKDQATQISSKYEDRWLRHNKNIYDMIFTNSTHSNELNLSENFEFGGEINFEKILQNFKNKTAKFDDYFVHFERIFHSNERALISVAFGSFFNPEHCYILVENGKAEYFIKKPLLTIQNIKAHKKIGEFLCNNNL